MFWIVLCPFNKTVFFRFADLISLEDEVLKISWGIFYSISSQDEENHLKEKEGLHVYGFLKDLPSLPE